MQGAPAAASPDPPPHPLCRRHLLCCLGVRVRPALSPQDPDIRVQYAALTALGMICADQQPAIQLHRHEAIVPALQRCMKSASVRVRVSRRCPARDVLGH